MVSFRYERGELYMFLSQIKDADINGEIVQGFIPDIKL